MLRCRGVYPASPEGGGGVAGGGAGGGESPLDHVALLLNTALPAYVSDRSFVSRVEVVDDLWTLTSHPRSFVAPDRSAPSPDSSVQVLLPCDQVGGVAHCL